MSRLLDSPGCPGFSRYWRLKLNEDEVGIAQGLIFGLALGLVVFRMLKSVDNYQVEVLLTLAAVTGG